MLGAYAERYFAYRAHKSGIAIRPLAHFAFILAGFSDQPF